MQQSRETEPPKLSKSGSIHLIPKPSPSPTMPLNTVRAKERHSYDSVRTDSFAFTQSVRSVSIGSAEAARRAGM